MDWRFESLNLFISTGKKQGTQNGGQPVPEMAGKQLTSTKTEANQLLRWQESNWQAQKQRSTSCWDGRKATDKHKNRGQPVAEMAGKQVQATDKRLKATEKHKKKKKAWLYF